jgi:hypothetical protein
MNKNISTMIISSLFFLFSSADFVFAQDFVPLGRLAQEYLIRATNPGDELNLLNQSQENPVILKQETIQKIPNDVIIVNPEVIFKNAVAESIDTITRTIQEFNQEKQKLIDDIKNLVKKDIDDSILKINRQTNTQTLDLQKIIELQKVQLFETITTTINSINITEAEKINEIKKIVTISIKDIEKILQDQAPDVGVNFESLQKEIQNRILNFEQRAGVKRYTIKTREGDLVFIDTDTDGLSNYDEMFIYRSNSQNANTVPGELTDGEKVKQGINPLSKIFEKKQYQDPRDDLTSFVSNAYKIQNIALIKEQNKLLFEGFALPNSFVTIYIFNRPIITTVKTDQDGRWSVELEQDFENGEHQMYVATIDANGKIIVRSNPVLFTKTAGAVSLGIIGSTREMVQGQNFFVDNLILIILSVLIVIIILTMMLVGNKRNLKSLIYELKNQVKT